MSDICCIYFIRKREKLRKIGGKKVFKNKIINSKQNVIICSFAQVLTAIERIFQSNYFFISLIMMQIITCCSEMIKQSNKCIRKGFSKSLVITHVDKKRPGRGFDKGGCVALRSLKPIPTEMVAGGGGGSTGPPQIK